MQVLRTPDERFEALSGFDYAPRYVELGDKDGLQALRLHYLDEGPALRHRSCSCMANLRGRTCTGR